MKIVVKRRRAILYQDIEGTSPYEEFLDDLRDVVAKAKLMVRVERAETGNFGDYKHLIDGVFEMKDNFGPGYRIYFAIDGDEIILLLTAGTKRGQDRDIDRAHSFLADYRHRKGAKK